MHLQKMGIIGRALLIGYVIVGGVSISRYFESKNNFKLFLVLVEANSVSNS